MTTIAILAAGAMGAGRIKSAAGTGLQATRAQPPP